MRENRHFPQKMPIASASANRAVHQRTECEKKHNRAPNRVPIRQILAARRGVAYSWEGGGCGGTYGNGVLYSGWCPGFRLGPLAVTVSFYSHFYIVYMACLSVDLSLSGQVCAGDFPFPALLNRGLVRSLPPLAVRVLRRERCDATAGVFCKRAGDALVEGGD